MRQNKYKFIYLLTGLLFLTPARAAIILILPLILFIINRYIPLEYNKSVVRTFIAIVIVSGIYNMIAGNTSTPYYLLSLWLVTPTVFLLFSNPKRYIPQISLDDFIGKTLWILYAIDLIGLYYRLKEGGQDEFGTGYGRHYEYVHGLAIINVLYALYFLNSVLKRKRTWKSLVKLFITIAAFALCDYGLGYIILFVSLIIWLLAKKQFKYVFFIALLIAGGAFMLTLDTFEYERENIYNARNNQGDARKVIMFLNTRNVESESFTIPLVGTGPGSYNSRALVLILSKNSPLYAFFDGQYPPYYYKYIYPLWNERFVSQDDYTDGTRNQPFSSAIALAIEYGLILFLIVAYFWIKEIRKYNQEGKQDEVADYLNMINIFMLVACCFHEWAICTEFFYFLIISTIGKNTLMIKEENAHEIQK
uniref:O-antigen ligase family protein n=1 Tax=Prevotella sp. GTC17260 TaxID=3236796 RepID=A0AB33JG36_9BACT